jgi:hypothetical protein
MPTPEFADLVSAIEEAMDLVLPTDQLMLPDTHQAADATTYSGPIHAFVLDFEKVIWHYPDACSRLIEEIA